jgi:dTDP-4-dehydrorhamnose 3,5-epimerase
MKYQFEKTHLPGVLLVTPKRHDDHRGTFFRLFDSGVFAEQGIDVSFVQTAISTNHGAGTLRGMHLQRPPFAETKLVSCAHGRLYDVVVDLRAESPTYCQWFGAELTPESRQMVLVPPGCAHGYLSLAEETELLYHISERYAPECEMGVAWNDPAFGIEWPVEPRIISERDQNHPPHEPVACASS